MDVSYHKFPLIFGLWDLRVVLDAWYKENCSWTPGLITSVSSSQSVVLTLLSLLGQQHWKEHILITVELIYSEGTEQCTFMMFLCVFMLRQTFSTFWERGETLKKKILQHLGKIRGWAVIERPARKASQEKLKMHSLPRVKTCIQEQMCSGVR